MACFKFSSMVKIHCVRTVRNETYSYAVSELKRILGRLNIQLSEDTTLKCGKGFAIAISAEEKISGKDMPPQKNLKSDSYILKVTGKTVFISAPAAKGILNGVYDLAERLGVVFLLPTEAGELIPGSKRSLPEGIWRMESRFEYRGVFLQLFEGLDYSEDEWLRFYAKLRFNAVRAENRQMSLCKELGLRCEVGGHGLQSFLPRSLFEKEPELFRMFQPEDFGGKRMKDSNFCVTNIKTRQIVQENFRKHLETVRGAYAIHAWADDLPAGGWCLCPSCRALPPTDQAMLAMRHLAEVAGKTAEKPRIPVIAYHDTMRPGHQIEAPKEGFLLYAPRERCYGHALDDPSCERNRFYMNALKEWGKKFKGIDDAHTFEYYFDQILFRGIYPFLPRIIFDDMKVYESNDITCHMSLQVGGSETTPEFNMLAFAKGLWNKDITAEKFIADMAASILPEFPAPWRKYLTSRARVFTEAMRMCGHNIDIYLDYRWLPETILPFGREMALAYDKAADNLDSIAASLEKAVNEKWPGQVRKLAKKEAKRAYFEAAELRVMARQQSAMNELADFMNTRDTAVLRKAIQNLEKACVLFKTAKIKAHAAEISEKGWYFKHINEWLTGEFRKKIENYKPALKS